MRCLFLLILLGLAAPAWSQTLLVSVEPLGKLMRGLYGDRVNVEVLLRPNQTPHQLALSPQQALKVRQADFLVWLGDAVEPPLAPLVARRDGPSLALLDVDGLQRHDATPHEAGHGHDASLDPHLWLSPHNMALLATQAGQVFPLGLQSDQPETLARNLQAWPDSPLPSQPRQADWLSYHNPWGYFLRALSLKEPITVSNQLNAGPGSQHFVTLARQLKRRNVQCMVVEPEARQGIMARLCPDCRPLSLDPLGRDKPSLDYLSWLDFLKQELASCLSVKGPVAE